MQKLPLSMRKANLQRLLARRPEGIFVSTLEQGEIGPDLFRKACEFGLEGDRSLSLMDRSTMLLTTVSASASEFASLIRSN